MRRLGQAGLTTLELVIAISMMSVIGLIVINFFTDSLLNYHRQESLVTLQSNTKQAIDAMARTVRAAQTIENVNSIVDANQPDGWETGEDIVVLATPSLDDSGSPIYADASHNTVYTDNVIFYVKDDIIWRRMLANPNASGNTATTTCPPAEADPGCPADSRVVENIATLQMAYDNIDPENSRTVTVTITRIRQAFGRTFTSTVTGKVTLRNK